MTESYTIFPCDLRQTDKVREQLTTFGVNPEVPTLIIAECLFCYLDGSSSESIIQNMTEYFKDDLFIVNFDMMHPKDAFGKMML